PDSITQTYREETPIPEAFNQVEDIHFEECSVERDLERPHKNQSLMSKW
ncbi:18508_t:CDS:1, partial [Funneliformis geosporum]